jgi:hypothetical protein
MPSHDRGIARVERDSAFDASGRFSVRAITEWVLRSLAILLLLFLIWQAVHALSERSVGRAKGAGIRSALASWSTRESPQRAHVVFDSTPDPDVRDWVAALRGSGTATSWEGPELTPSALSLESVADPKHATRVWVAAASGSGIVIRDALGPIDSVFVRSGGAVLTTQKVSGVVSAALGGAAATAVLRDSLTVRPVLLIGIASWEGKFILASLEEHGWTVDARFSIGPNNSVVQAGRLAAPRIDTAHYSVVIALDSAAARYAASIGEYVRQGGGFIATGAAAAIPAFAGLMPGATAAVLESGSFDVDSATPRRALALMPIDRLKAGALAIEKRDANTAVAARRVGKGRVVQVGYIDTWRWRMGGADDPVTAYRGWWSAMVSSVAYAPRIPLHRTSAVEPTPVATLVGTLGVPTSVAEAGGTFLNDPRLLPALFALLLAVLFLEWTSRRLRGRP